MTSSDTTNIPESTNQRYLELAIPLLSFGATFAGILLWRAGFEIGFQYFSIGCAIGSVLLAYLAWIRPKKDIVALSTPIYAFIFFVVPTDYASGVLLQLLYASSLTLLLVRLKYRFGESHTAVSSGKELSAPLRDYIGKTREAVTSTNPRTGHTAAVAISQFSLGEYAAAARTAATGTGQPEETGELLARAFGIVSEQGRVLERSIPRPEPFLTFSPEHESLLAKPLQASDSEDRRFDATLDNALLLLFSAAWNTSEEDRGHLLACQGFAMRLLED